MWRRWPVLNQLTQNALTATGRDRPASNRDLANDFFGIFISSQTQKDRLTELVVAGPLGKLDLSNQHWLDPVAAFHDCRRNPLAPSSRSFLRQIDERTGYTADFLHAIIQACQSLFGEAGPDSSGEKETLLSVVADQQSAEIFATAFWWRVTADHELLLLHEFEFYPGAAAPAAHEPGAPSSAR